MMEWINLLGRLIAVSAIVILTLGGLLSITTKQYAEKNWTLTYLLFLLATEGLASYIGFYRQESVFFMFILSFFLHFSFLNLYYNHFLFQHPPWKTLLSASLGLIPFLLFVLPEPYYQLFRYYDRLPFSFSIMLASLLYFYQLVSGKRTYEKPTTLLNASILLFFSLDAFLALATEYLIHENLILVSGFWTIRAICLQLFYSALIYHGWARSKMPLQF
ncbi:hypothetical protein [Saprospira grandis]|uniref:hypothetical protein n=1 Tax=Saprospira grandis TaxID=1008 RepID=UPI0011D1D367|nr:hypothetical protein [Saprospira grandis]